MDIDVLRTQIQGLQGMIRNLREDERKLERMQAIREQETKARMDAQALSGQLKETKEQKVKLQAQKAASLAQTTKKLSIEITGLLPDGEAVVNIADGSFLIGWRYGGTTTPYLGLSGGEKVCFDLALAHALLGKSQEKILIGECAEIDDKNLQALLSAIVAKHPETQILLSTCHFVAPPEGWKLVNIQ